jgi:DNA-directed RNA polymerase subunit K/omega
MESVSFMTRFERAQMLGTRAQQLSNGAPCNLSEEEMVGVLSAQEAARKELDLGRSPLTLKRTLPTGRTEECCFLGNETGAESNVVTLARDDPPPPPKKRGKKQPAEPGPKA